MLFPHPNDYLYRFIRLTFFSISYKIRNSDGGSKKEESEFPFSNFYSLAGGIVLTEKTSTNDNPNINDNRGISASPSPHNDYFLMYFVVLVNAIDFLTHYAPAFLTRILAWEKLAFAPTDVYPAVGNI